MATGAGPKICLIGAGGMSFGPVMVLDAINTRRIRGATMMLHDVSPERLEVARRFATRVNDRNGRPITIEASLDPSEALSGADFCLTSAEVGRWQHWIEDYEVPVRHGSTQITGENGGPGAVFHSLRSIRTMLGICGDIERYCPDTFLINLTNPLSRVTLAVNAGTSVKNISMCHEFAGGVGRIARLLRVPKSKIAAKASGINHFTFFTEIKRSDTGEDLYPRLRRLWQKRFFDFPPPVTAAAQQLVKVPWVQMMVEQMYSPLVAHMFREYGLLPCSVDSHIGEYVPFAKRLPGGTRFRSTSTRGSWPASSGWSPATATVTRTSPCTRRADRPKRCFPSSGPSGRARPGPSTRSMSPTAATCPTCPRGPSSRFRPSPTGTEWPRPTCHPSIEPLAEFMRTQIELQELVVNAAIKGDPALAFDALRRDPLFPADEASCRKIFDELMVLQADALPF